VVERGDVGHDGTLIRLLDCDIDRIEERGDAKLFRDVKCQLEIVEFIFGVERVKVNQIRAMGVDEGGKGEAVVERLVKVVDVDVGIALGLLLAPEEQAVLGRHMVDANVLDLEAQDDGPDQAQREHWVAIGNVLGTNVGQGYLEPVINSFIIIYISCFYLL